jgi:hypothetical protein
MYTRICVRSQMHAYIQRPFIHTCVEHMRTYHHAHWASACCSTPRGVQATTPQSRACVYQCVGLHVHVSRDVCLPSLRSLQSFLAADQTLTKLSCTHTHTNTNASGPDVRPENSPCSISSSIRMSTTSQYCYFTTSLWYVGPHSVPCKLRYIRVRIRVCTGRARRRDEDIHTCSMPCESACMHVCAWINQTCTCTCTCSARTSRILSCLSTLRSLSSERIRSSSSCMIFASAFCARSSAYLCIHT